MAKRDLERRIRDLEAENLELRARAGKLPEMPRNTEGLPFSGPRLITARNRRGMSVNETAEALHVDRRTYIGFESETVAPTMEQIGDMSMLLHFPHKWFFATEFWLVDPDSISWRDRPYQWNADNLHTRKWVR